MLMQAKRRARSPKARAKIFAAREGRCHICGEKITASEKWDLDHIIALGISGDDSDGNLAPAHIACHRRKTSKADVPAIAKAKRMEKRLGPIAPPCSTTCTPIPKPQKRERKPTSFRTNRNGAFKKKMDGSIERRAPS